MKLGVTRSAKVGPRRVKLLEKARNIKPGERVFDSGTSFVVKDVCVSAEFVAFIDTDGVRHGVYHPAEYLGLQVYLDEFVFRHNRRNQPMAAFQTLLGLGTRQKSTAYGRIRGALDLAKTSGRG